VSDMDEACRVANFLAPEHMQIQTREPRALVAKIRSAGAVFVGPWTPVAVGDYFAGPSHTLPTGGGGASFAGLTVDQFQRRTSTVEYSPAALRQSLPALSTFAAVEGLDAHGRSARLRLENR
jgi:histidinol dehydrogenase